MGGVLCAHNKCVESNNNPNNKVGDRRENERPRPRIASPLVSVDRPALFFQSQGLKVGGSTARWVFAVTAILEEFPDVCLVKIAHYSK